MPRQCHPGSFRVQTAFREHRRGGAQLPMALHLCGIDTSVKTGWED